MLAYELIGSTAMKKNYPSRAANVPVTQKMLYAVRDELNSSISALDAKVDSRFHQLTAQIHQMKILVEEQNSKNNIVLDGLTNLFERHTRLDHSFREDGLISDDLKIGQPRYSGASPTDGRADYARLGAGVGRKQASFAKGMIHRI
jgi:hypothetical protein